MSLRTKQALILLLATVLPFALGGAAMAFVVAPAYRRLVSRTAEMETRRLAEHISWNLTRDIARLERLAAWSEVRRLAARVSVPQSGATRLQTLWPSLSADAPPLQSIFRGLVAQELRWTQERDLGALELIVTNARGQVVAASVKPEDYLQADEGWWRETFDQGTGRVYVSQVQHDPGLKTWVIEVAVPIYADGTPGSGAVGVLKMTLDAQRAFEDVRRVSGADSVQALLVDARGRVVISPDAGPVGRVLRPLPLHLLKNARSGAHVTRSGDDGELFAWAEVPLTPVAERSLVSAPTLYVVTGRSAEEAFGPVRAVHRWMLGIGLVTILVAVVLGYWLAEVLVVRQVRTLARGMRKLAEGDFDRAAAIARDLTRSDGCPERNGSDDPVLRSRN
jgi:hypothetical protein